MKKLNKILSILLAIIMMISAVTITGFATICDKNGHISSEELTENAVDPTCTTVGHIDSVVYCTVCGEELNRETVVIPATGHSYSADVTFPTGTSQGYTTYTCYCGDSFVADIVDTWQVGDIIEFGSYPQSEVTDETLLAELNSLDLNWISYEYYSGTGDWDDGNMQPGDYMKFADVTYNTNKYRAIIFTHHRPCYTGYKHSDNTYQHGDTDTVYWFKFEPIQWRVLDPDEGFIMCEKIIDSQAYNNTIYYNDFDNNYYQDSRCTTYANDYATSSIRTWLNKDFYNTAFSTKEKGEISYSTQDNRCRNSNRPTISYPEHDSATTYDKIFLLSYDEASNPDYGFFVADDASHTRRAEGTNYAKYQGLNNGSYMYYTTFDWWLRSPYPVFEQACKVTSAGNSGDYATYPAEDDVVDCSIGIRPALKLNSKIDNLKSNTISSSKNDIVISTKWFDNTPGNVLGISLLGVKCTIGSKVTENNIYTITFNIPSSNDSQKVTLSKDEFQNYIIPKAVIESWKAVELDETEESAPAYNHTAMMKKDAKDGKPYVSTVFAKKGNNAYLNATQSDIKVFKNKDYDIIISADNLGGKSCAFYIEQDANHKISSSTGVFSSVDLYSKLDFDKACYAYVKTSNGVISELVPVNFTKQPANAWDEDVDFLKSSTFNLLGSNFLGFTIPSDVPLIGDAKISLNAFQLPAGFEFDGDSLKISIGANIFHTDNTPENAKKEFRDKCFTDWKNLCDDTMYSNDKKARNKYKNAKKDFEKRWFGKAGEAATSKNWDVNALGYIDATIVNGQTVVKEAYLSLGGEFSFKYTQQGAIWVIPAYVYAQMGAYFGGAANGSRVVADSEIPFQWDWTLKFEPKVQIGAGAGVKDVLSAGIWANATTPVVFNFTNNHLKWDLTGAIGIEAEFCVLKAEKTLFEGSMNLVNKHWGTFAKFKTATYQYFGLSKPTRPTLNTEISVIDRDYLENTSPWLSGTTTWGLRDIAQDGLSLTALQTSVLNQASPQVVAFGDKMLMTWVEDDASRDTYNRMRLVYSIYENGIWSEPVAVCDDGKNDMNPVIATDGTDVYFAWQKVDEIITEDTATIDNLTKKTEIYTAKYDSSANKIVDTINITGTSCYEYAQNISIVNGKPVCYFVSCSDNNMNTGSNNWLLSYDFDGTSVPSLVKTNLNYILSVAGAYVDGKENISYSMDADGDTTTTDDVTVYTLANRTVTAFDKGDNEVAYTNVFYGELDGKQTLFTSDMGNIYYVQDGETKAVIDGDRAITGNFNYVVKNGVPTLFWTEKEEIGNSVYSSSYENDVWTTPVRVSNTETQLSSVDVVVYDDEFRGVCTSSDLEYNDAKEGYECVQTNLCSFKINEVQDISVDDIYIDEENIKIGEVTEFDVYVTNNGTETVNNISFEIADTLGYSSTVTKNVKLASGEGSFITLSYIAPNNYSKTTLTVTATCNEIVDNNTENDTAIKEIGKSSLVLTESEVIEVNGQYLINAMITNESDVVAENVVINTLLNDSEDVVDTMTIESIGARETYSIEYVVSADDLTFDEENDTARVYITVDETNEKVTGNKICYVIAKPVELECGHISTEVVNGYEPTCTTAGSEGCVQCTLCGEIIEELGEIPAAGHNYSSEVVEPTCTDEGYTVYTCENCYDSYNSDYVDAHGHSFVDDVCEYCGETAYNYTFYIQKPSRTEIRNKDMIMLHAVIEGNAPKGSYIEWERSNANFVTGDEGDGVYLIMADDKGYTTFTATLYDANGNVIAWDSVEMYSKSGFFDKIGGFFRSLFGTTKVYDN